VLVLVVTLTSRAGIASTQLWAAELRATSCCLERCQAAPRHPLARQNCCYVGSSAADPATTGQATNVGHFAPPALAAGEQRVLLAPVVLVVKDFPGTRAGPPVYLRELSLRL